MPQEVLWANGRCNRKVGKKVIFINIITKACPALNVHVTSADADELTDVEKLCKTWNLFLCANQVAFDNRQNAPVAVEHRVISVGRHEPQKGFDILIKSFCEFEKNNNDLKLVIIGVEGTETDRLHELAKNSKNIIFEKPMGRQDLQNFMRSSLALISTSRYENYGNTILEALSCGMLVILPTHLPWEDVSKFSYRYDSKEEKLSKILEKLGAISLWHADKKSLQLEFVHNIKSQNQTNALLMFRNVKLGKYAENSQIH